MKPLALAALGLATLVACGASPAGDVAGAKGNRLAGETSPYLLLHAGDPVDWYPWGAEAFAKAREEDKPIFLSVGYSSCYWCHVMGRETFSDPAIAALLRDGFVAIKVDREERPDVDEMAITAVQLLNGSGGWPTSLFLTPSLEPFFGGTYFPPAARGNLPAFATVLREVRTAWTSRRAEVERTAADVRAALADAFARNAPAASGPPPLAAVDAAVAALQSAYDERHGGFGRAPKFPSPGRLAFVWEAPDPKGKEGRNRTRVVETLRRIARGGIHDHLGGGFHRYTVDAAWRVPHFEKMLYDNALLLELFAVAATEGPVAGDAELQGAARDAADFLLGAMALPGGGFRAAIDAESVPASGGEAEEGAYYVWTAEELRSALGEQGFAVLAPVYGFGGEPDLPGGRHVLRLDASLEEQASVLGETPSAVRARLAPHLAALRAARAKRPPPRTDDKALADWNGLAIAALASAGRLLGEPRYLAAAEAAARFTLGEMRTAEGELLHSYAAGEASVRAFLDDYAFLIRGLLELDVAKPADRRWRAEAERLAEELERRLAAPGGGYHLAAADPGLLVRSQTVTEGALPAGNGVAILDLLELARRTGKATYRERAERALAAFAHDLERYPASAPTLALAVWRYRSAAPPQPASRQISRFSGATAWRSSSSFSIVGADSPRS